MLPFKPLSLKVGALEVSKLGASVAPNAGGYPLPASDNLAFHIDMTLESSYSDEDTLTTLVNRITPGTGNMTLVNGDPNFDTGIINSLDAARFEAATTDNIRAANISQFDMGTGSFEAFVVIQTSTADTSSDVIFCDKDDTSTNDIGWLIAQTSNKARTFISDGTNSFAVSGTTNLNDGMPHLIEIRIDKTLDELRLYVDGTQEGSTIDITGLGTVTWTSPIRFASCGNEGLNKRQWTGHIGEAGLYNTLLSAADRTARNNILSTKWGF